VDKSERKCARDRLKKIIPNMNYPKNKLLKNKPLPPLKLGQWRERNFMNANKFVEKEQQPLSLCFLFNAY